MLAFFSQILLIIMMIIYVFGVCRSPSTLLKVSVLAQITGDTGTEPCHITDLGSIVNVSYHIAWLTNDTVANK